MDAFDALRERASRLGMIPGLEATRSALARLGDPHLSVPCVHVAGSNGKGSTAAMIEAIARAAGLCTGLYTSPHLCRVTEVIRLDGEPVGDEAFTRAVAAVMDLGSTELTAFEALTVSAFRVFREAGVDLAIIEAGLGGLRDATNVIERPLATALTSVTLEHTAQLGPTIAHIAREKAGIFKPGAPVVLGALDAEAASVAEEAARAIGAGPIVKVGIEARDGEIVLRPGAPHPAITVKPGLRGPHQAENAAVAAGVAWILAARWPAVGENIARGIAEARWPGRLERIPYGSVTLLLDCAHNPHAAAALARALPEEGCAPERTSLVFGALRDKAYGEMLSVLAPLAARRFYTTPRGRSAAALDDLARVAPGETIEAPRAALARAVAQAQPGDTVVVTGSSYLVGEIRAAALGLAYDPALSIELSARGSR